ncbi:MAG: helix-turn-helix domain-containing protein, partial [Acidimicrobiia bacterium]
PPPILTRARILDAGCRRSVRRTSVLKATWRLRMAAAERGVWSGAELRRLLAERGGMSLSPASVSALLTKQPAQVRLATLAAVCAALDCTPNDLITLEPVPAPAPRTRRDGGARR